MSLTPRIAISLAFYVVAVVVAGSLPAGATTCAEAVAECQIEGSGKDQIVEKCHAAGASCMKTGMFVGPVTGKKWNVRKR